MSYGYASIIKTIGEQMSEIKIQMIEVPVTKNGNMVALVDTSSPVFLYPKN